MKKISLKSYVIGFALSIILTLCSYVLVVIHINSRHTLPPDEILIPLIIGIALLQLIVQLIFFLHMVHESKPRWNLIFFISTVGLILIMIVGAIWIMNHLNNNMTPQEMNKFIQTQDGF